jgi:hypothetical protein
VGKRDGPSGTTIGNVTLKWVCAKAAGLFWRATPAGQKYLARLENNRRPGKAFTILAHQ